MDRPSQIAVLMETADVWSRRSTCDRLHVGSVIAKDNRIVATGYNGAPAGVEHCHHECDCQYKDAPKFEPDGAPVHSFGCNALYACTLSVHAEANAICFAAKHGVSLAGAVVYTTHAPCFNCSLLILSAGIVGVIFETPFRDMSGPEFLTKNEVHCGQFNS